MKKRLVGYHPRMFPKMLGFDQPSELTDGAAVWRAGQERDFRGTRHHLVARWEDLARAFVVLQEATKLRELYVPPRRVQWWNGDGTGWTVH